jgi:hypothetical protein
MFPPVDGFIGIWLMLIMLPVLLLATWCAVLIVLAVPAWAVTRVVAWVREKR